MSVSMLKLAMHFWTLRGQVSRQLLQYESRPVTKETNRLGSSHLAEGCNCQNVRPVPIHRLWECVEHPYVSTVQRMYLCRDCTCQTTFYITMGHLT